MDSDEPQKPRRGRPPGVRNRPKPLPLPPMMKPASGLPAEDYFHADPETMISRQLTLIDWMQQALKNEMRSGLSSHASGQRLDIGDVKKLVELSNALARTVEALKRSSDLAEEMAKRMTSEQLLEAALLKIEAQDRSTLRHAIRRLRDAYERMTPKEKIEPDLTAAAAIAALESE